MKTIIYRKLEPTTKLVPILTSGEEGRLRIYLICDEYDVENIGPLEDYLFHQNYEVITPVFEGDEAEIRQMHEDYLRECHAVIIYYGVGNELWQRRKLSELRKSTGQGRSNPLLVSGIYVAPPATPHKIRLQTHEALVIRQPETGFNSNVLMPFLAQFVQNQVKRVD